MAVKGELSPMMQQYIQIHDEYPDCLLLFRLGDFYELFFEDAKTASRELELTLMLWKIDTGTTGFAYRREKIVNPGVELE